MFRGICNGVVRLSSITKYNFTCFSDSIQLGFPFLISRIFFFFFHFSLSSTALVFLLQLGRLCLFNFSGYFACTDSSIRLILSFSLRRTRYSMYIVAYTYRSCRFSGFIPRSLALTHIVLFYASKYFLKTKHCIT